LFFLWYTTNFLLSDSNSIIPINDKLSIYFDDKKVGSGLGPDPDQPYYKKVGSGLRPDPDQPFDRMVGSGLGL
jgi:hypothetical protein